MTAVLVLARAGSSLAPLWLLILVVLPWLPFPVPPAFLIWAGRLDLLVWLAVALLLAGGGAARKLAEGPAVGRAACRPQLLAGVLSAVIFGAAAWFAAPSVPGGDEPHYLVISQSLLLDGDLQIENNHLRGDYKPYFAGQLKPDYIRRGQDGEIYSIHAPGISALVAPAFAVGGYPAVLLFLIGVAALGGGLMWHVSWLATRHRAAAWFGWAAITSSATTIFHSFTVYPDGLGGTIVLVGVWGLLRAEAERREPNSATPWVVHGAALALLPWLHTRFALLAGSLGTLLLLRLFTTANPLPRVLAFLSVPAVSALAWFGYFLVIYGTPNPSAPYGTTREFSAAFIPGGLAGLLFDQRFGLVATAPVLLCAAAGLGMMILRRPAPGPEAAGSPRRLALELVFIVTPYLLIVTSFAMWWGGWSAPARFAAVVLPSMAIPCAAAWLTFRTSAARVMAAGALTLTAFISAALIVPEGGRLAFNTRDAPALWLEWASPVADLARGVPLWVRGGEQTFFVEILVWAASLTLAAALVRMLPLRRGQATVYALVFAVAGMGAVIATWTLHGDNGTSETPAQLGFLRRLSREPAALTMRLVPPARASFESVIEMIRIDPNGSHGAPGPANRPLLVLPGIPAGRYRIRTESEDPAGSLMAGIGQEQHPLRTEALTSETQSFEVAFPVDVRALIVDGDEPARRAVTSIAVEPVSIVRGADRLTNAFGRRFLRYGATSVYFLDDRSFPEPDAFWVGGSRSSSVVLQADASPRTSRLLLRNAPVQNSVRLEAGDWRADLALAAGEERYLDVPLDESRGATIVTISSSAGFRPSDVEAGSRDERFLGVWIKVDPEPRTGQVP